jgi:hypothetical protein
MARCSLHWVRSANVIRRGRKGSGLDPESLHEIRRSSLLQNIGQKLVVGRFILTQKRGPLAKSNPRSRGRSSAGGATVPCRGAAGRSSGICFRSHGFCLQ